LNQQSESINNNITKDTPKKRWICVLIIALTISSLFPVFALFISFPFLFFMVPGILMGVVALYKLRKKISRMGFVISVIAIIWSIAWLLIYIRIFCLMSRGLFP